MFCMACGKRGAGGLFCSQECNDRQAMDPFCPTYDVGTGRLETKCRSCMAELGRPGDMVGVQTTNGIACIRCLAGMVQTMLERKA